jgi:hypothetical protein
MHYTIIVVAPLNVCRKQRRKRRQNASGHPPQLLLLLLIFGRDKKWPITKS